MDGKAEIRQLTPRAHLPHEQIFRFDVAVHDSVGVEVRHRGRHRLDDFRARRLLREDAAGGGEIVENVTPSRELKEEVDVPALVLEGAVEGYDAPVRHPAVNLNLALDLREAERIELVPKVALERELQARGFVLRAIHRGEATRADALADAEVRQRPAADQGLREKVCEESAVREAPVRVVARGARGGRARAVVPRAKRQRGERRPRERGRVHRGRSSGHVRNARIDRGLRRGRKGPVSSGEDDARSGEARRHRVTVYTVRRKTGTRHDGGG